VRAHAEACEHDDARADGAAHGLELA
jgi:hypothetical protein